MSTWKRLKEDLWSRLPESAKTVLKIIAPQPDLFILGLVIIVIGLCVALPIPRPATLDDMDFSHVCITDVYKVHQIKGGDHWELKTTQNRYYILGSFREAEALRDRMYTASFIMWPDDGKESETIRIRGLIADIWCFHGNNIYEVRIDGEPVVIYKPPKAEEMRDNSKLRLRVTWIGGLALILCPIADVMLKRPDE